MKQRKVSKRLLGVLLLCSFILVAQPVNAQDVDGAAVTKFQPNNNIVNPVDPNPGDDNDIVPVHPPTEGPLSINYASDVSFGQHKKGRKDETFYAKEDTVTLISSGETKTYPNFVQVTDLRGTASGWVLSVRQNGPLKNDKGEALKGAKMRVTAQNIVSQSNMTGVPSGLAIDQVLEDDGSTFHPIVKAEAETGLATWNVFLGVPGQETSGISLTVPKDIPQKVGIYTTTLTWSLKDAL